MSETLAGGSSRIQKNTCRKCNRTVYVFVIDGVRYETDPELITFISDGKATIARGRELHSAKCLRYQSEAARIKALAAAKRNKPT